MCQKCDAEEQEPANVLDLAQVLELTQDETLILLKHKGAVRAEIGKGDKMPADLTLQVLLKACVRDTLTERQRLALAVTLVSGSLMAQQRDAANPLMDLLAQMAKAGNIPLPGGMEARVMQIPSGMLPALPDLEELDPHKGGDPTEDEGPLKQALFQALHGAGKPKNHKGH
jgi:hypothetical protein